jgi:2-phospho-L-lactate guanylyltransferase
MAWSAVVPVKGLAHAKSRLATSSSSDHLALAFAQDTISALLATDGIGRVIVATSDPVVTAWTQNMGGETFDDAEYTGINPAVIGAANQAPAGDGIVVVLADLPCLTAIVMNHVLGASGEFDHSFLADAHGTGTTMWFSREGMTKEPHFGSGSRAAHAASGSVDLVLEHGEEAWPKARRDVDTVDDLTEAIALGVGTATRRALDTTHGIEPHHDGRPTPLR